MKRIILSLFVVLIGYGCATANQLKKLPEKDLYISWDFSEKKKALHWQEIVSRHPEWPETVRHAILKGEIQEGMTKDQVLASWGTVPEILGREIDGQAVWFYPKKALIFNGDKLVEISERYQT